MTYPQTPGFTEHVTGKAAADAIAGKAPTIRERLMLHFRAGQRLTAYEAADLIDVPYHSVQPRISELGRMGQIEKLYTKPGPYKTHVWVWGTTS